MANGPAYVDTVVEQKVTYADMRPDEFITLGNDYMEISRMEDSVVESGGVFDSRVDKSVVESDYSCGSSEDSEEDDGSGKRGQAKRGFMLGCYTTPEMESDLEYQEIVAKRLQATTADIREFDQGFEWEFKKMDLPGVPLKHFLDNFARHGKVRHDEECPTNDHDAFFNDFVSVKQSS